MFFEVLSFSNHFNVITMTLSSQTLGASYVVWVISPLHSAHLDLSGQRKQIFCHFSVQTV